MGVPVNVAWAMLILVFPNLRVPDFAAFWFFVHFLIFMAYFTDETNLYDKGFFWCVHDVSIIYLTSINSMCFTRQKK